MDDFKHFVDAISIGAVLTTLAGLLPPIAALMSLIWSLIRIYETRTVQRWLKGDRYDRRNK